MEGIVKTIITSLLAKDVDDSNIKSRLTYTVVILILCAVIGAGYMVLDLSIKSYGSANARALDARNELLKSKADQIAQLTENLALMKDALEDSERIAQIYLDNYNNQQDRLSDVISRLNRALEETTYLRKRVEDLTADLDRAETELRLYREIVARRKEE